MVAAALDDIAEQAQTAADTESVSKDGDTMTGTLNFTSAANPLIASQYGEVLWHDDQFSQDLIKQAYATTIGDYLQLRAGGNGSNVIHKFGEGYADLGGYLKIDGVTRIDNSGNATLGTISSGVITATGNIKSSGVAHPEFELIPTGSVGNADIRFDGTSLDIRSNSSSAYLTLQTATTERLKITSTGDFEFNGGDLSEIGSITSSGQIRGTNLRAINTAGYGQIEVGGANGAYVDLKRPDTDDYDVRIVSDAGTGGRIQSNGVFDIDAAGDITLDADGGDIHLKDNGSSMASFTTSTTKIFGDVGIGGNHTPLNPLHVRDYGGTHLLALGNFV